MTTLTTRPIPLLPLVLPISMYCNDRPSSTGSGSSPSSLGGGIPQSDNSFFQRHHEVTSPRISSTGSSYSRNCANSPHCIDSVLDIGQERRKTRNFHHMERGPDREEDDYDKTNDRMSCCSDDSELSVGQEECSGTADSVTTKNGRLSGVNNNRDQVIDDCESADNVSSLSDDNRVTAGSEPLGNDEASSDSIRDSGDSVLLSNAMNMGMQAGSVIRPSPTRLQEEFLRKSHLYAEQLMKQQMQFMAVARASAFQLHHGAITPEICKVGFRPPEVPSGFSNFSGIQSHLSAISKISQMNCDESALSKLTAFGLSSARELSQSPPSSLHHLHPHHTHPLLPHQLLNNNLNETSLKFSIDNILKADFGRRITEPILKRTPGQSAGSIKTSSGSRRTSNKINSEKHGAPIDLTSSLLASSSVINNNNNINHSLNNSAISPPSGNLRVTCDLIPSVTSPNPASPSSCASTATASVVAQSVSPSTSAVASTTNANGGSSGESSSSSTTSSNNGSGGPMVWPAWVYCTRYSDRPSSGRSKYANADGKMLRISPRTRKPKKSPGEKASSSDEKRPRTAFSGPQLARLKHEFNENRYLTERRRQQLSAELGLNEAQIKIWFQNKRAKIKKASGTKNPLALQLMAQGLYNHSTIPLSHEEEELQELHAKSVA